MIRVKCSSLGSKQHVSVSLVFWYLCWKTKEDGSQSMRIIQYQLGHASWTQRITHSCLCGYATDQEHLSAFFSAVTCTSETFVLLTVIHTALGAHHPLWNWTLVLERTIYLLHWQYRSIWEGLLRSLFSSFSAFLHFTRDLENASTHKW